MFGFGKKTYAGPTWKDVSIGVTIGKKTMSIFEIIRKLFWNVINIISNARSIWRTLCKAVKEVCHA